MSEQKYQEIFESWRNKTLSAGFTLNEFRSRYNFFIEHDNTCELTRAVGAKMAYVSLIRQRQEELNIMQREMENVRWL